MYHNEFIADKLASVNRIVFFTGAGISAESGVPTFRGKEGIWQKFRPEELANFNTFLTNPNLVWEWYQYRRRIIRSVLPNAGHLAITELQKLKLATTVITQNVDNLHKRAGNNNVIELHGNIENNYCIECKKRYDNIEFINNNTVPLCECGGKIRPDVVWFGENLPPGVFQSAEKAVLECDVFFSIGTSSIVYPAASLPILASRNNKFLIEINPNETELSYLFNVVIREKSGEVLPKIVSMTKEKSGSNEK